MALVLERRFGESITVTVEGVGELLIRPERSSSSNRVDLVITGPKTFRVGRLEKGLVDSSHHTLPLETNLP